MNESFDDKYLDDPEFQSLLVECIDKLDRGETLDRHSLLSEHPHYAEPLAAFLDDHANLRQLARELGDSVSWRTKRLAQARESAATIDSNPKVNGFARGAQIRYIGDYEILDEIASGGMGVVFKARQANLNRVVALKMIRSGQLANSADVDRFRREARAAAAMQHPNIVSVHEVGEQDGHHYFTMDFIEGVSLADQLREDSLPPRKAVELIKTVAEAVDYAHHQGVLHRDLKPANVLIAKNGGTPHVTDFGLAKAIAESTDQTHADLTTTGQILGTPSYMSPEQASAKNNLVGVPSDVYSLGAVLYACLCGRAPFVADSPIDTLKQVIEREPVPLQLLSPHLPKDLENICLKCLRKEPHQRYGTAKLLAEDLGRFLEGRPVRARPVSRPAKAWRWAKRNPTIASLAALSVLLLVGGSAVSTFFAIEADQRADAEADQRQRADHEAHVAQLARNDMHTALLKEETAHDQAEQARTEAEQARDQEAKARQLTEGALAGEAVAHRQAIHAARTAQWETYVARLQPLRQSSIEQEWGYLDRLLDDMIPQKGQSDYRGWEWYFFQDQVRSITPTLSHTLRFNGYFIYDPPRHRMFAWTDGKLAIWDLQTRSLVKTLSTPSLVPETVSVSPEGRYVVGRPWSSNQALVWDMEKDRQVAVLNIDEADENNVKLWATAWNPEGSQLATGSRSGEIRIWHTSDWSLEKVLQKASHRNTIGKMDWNANSGLATGHRFGWFRIWDVEAGKVLHTAKCQNSILECVKWNPSGTRLALASSGLGIFSAEAKRIGEPLWPGVTTTVAWLDDNTLAAGGQDQDIRICNAEDLHDFQRLRVHSGYIRSLAFLDDKTIVGGADDDAIRLTRLDVALPAVERVEAHKGRATEIEWSPDGAELATSGQDGHVRVWNAETLQQVHELGEAKHPYVWDVAWNNEGDQLASIDHLGRLNLWDAESGSLVGQLQLSNLDHPRLDWRPSDEFLILGGNRPQIVQASPLKSVWTAEQPYLGWRVEFHVSPDGKRAAGTGQFCRFVAIDLEQQEVIKDTYLGGSGTGAGAWSPDGKLFATAGTDLVLLDGQTFDRVEKLEGHHGAVGGVCFNPTGTRIASTGNDGSVYFWDVATGDLLLRLPLIDDGELGAIEWSPDGHRLATVTQRGELIVLGTPQLDDHAKQLEVLGDYVESPDDELTLLSQATRTDPKNPEMWRNRARWYAKHLLWGEALQDYDQFTELNPYSLWTNCEAASAALMAGDREAYQRYLDKSLSKLGSGAYSNGSPVVGAYLTEVAILVPDSVDDFAKLLPFAERFANEKPEVFIHQKAQTLLEYRLGHYQRVLELLEPHLNRGGYNSEQVLVDSLRALALFRLGRTVDATVAMHDAEVVADNAWPDPTMNPYSDYGDLGSYVAAKMLLTEAQSVVKPILDDRDKRDAKETPADQPTERMPSTATPPTAEYYRQLSKADENPEAGNTHSIDVRPLVRNLDSENAKERTRAIEALIKVGPDAAPALPKLLDILKREDSHEKLLAIRCVARIGPAASEAVPVLLEILESDDSGIFRMEAAGALTQMGPAGETAIPSLIKLLKNPGEFVKSYPSGDSPSAMGLMTPLMHEGGYFDSRDTTYMAAIGALGTFGVAAQDAIPEIERIRDAPGTLPAIRDWAERVIDHIQSEVANQAPERESPPQDAATADDECRAMELPVYARSTEYKQHLPITAHVA